MKSILRRPDGSRVTGLEIARQTGLNYMTVWKALHGYTRMTLKTGLLMSAALGISPWKLQEYNDRIRKTDRPKIAESTNGSRWRPGNTPWSKILRGGLTPP